MLELARIFQNGMILQRDKTVYLWGKGNAGAEVSASIQNKTGKCVADENGNWKIDLPPLLASDSEEMCVSSGRESIVLKDVAVGEVWVAGGQSNMEFYMRYEKHRDEAFLNCEDSRIRFFDVPELCFDGQEALFDYSRMGIWRSATRGDLEYFSAVGYYFQKELSSVLNVPVGIIGCNWGGTTSSVWIPADIVERVGKPWMEEHLDSMKDIDMDAYWEKQKINPINNRGNPFGDSFNETVLPRTLSEEEGAELFSNMPADIGYFMSIPMPSMFPGCLYEHMVKRIAPVTIRGFLWYQGESDDEHGHSDIYEQMLTALIGAWRTIWNDEKLPFFIVQLPGFYKWLNNPPGNNYMTIRKAQASVAEHVPYTWLCSISDAGEEFDIHPKDKRTVGHRLALLAQGHVYGKDIICDAPAASSIWREGNTLKIAFKNGKGLHIKGEGLSAMRIIANEMEIPFVSSVEDETLVLTLLTDIKEPLSVSFARTCWFSVNLYNEADIPATPFEFELNA